ncbi:hypothetical protein DSO57_1011359 [Entomophthora muscae]|uniref:Uncharacterized protein n=1 Tax=Entomophthora muscae TaxID=34485 RepID=A0ACC2SVH0_9FUNG|nr:hypothetical protein DSO57_1011359 [Entomophthora muscae]
MIEARMVGIFKVSGESRQAMKLCSFALVFAVTYAADSPASLINVEALEKLKATASDSLKPLLEGMPKLSSKELEDIKNSPSLAKYDVKAIIDNAAQGKTDSRVEQGKAAIEKAKVISDAALQKSDKAIKAAHGDIKAAGEKIRNEAGAIDATIRLGGEDAIKTSEEVAKTVHDGVEAIGADAVQGSERILEAAQNEVKSAGDVLKTTDEKEKSMSDGDISEKSGAKRSIAAKANATASTAVAGKRSNETATLETPIVTPAAVNANKVSPLELSLVWQSDCKTTQTPSVKISVDANSIDVGAAISSNPNSGFKIQATSNGNPTTLQGSQADDAVAKTNYTSLVYTPEMDVKKGSFKINFLYLAQKVRQGQENTASIDVEVTCGKNITKFTQAEKTPVLIKVSSATTLTIALAAVILLSLFNSL